MAYADIIAHAREVVSEFHQMAGILCAVRGLTWNADKGLFEPPYSVKAINVPFTIVSLSTLTDPDLPATARDLQISYEDYRQLTCAVGHVEFAPEDTIITEPVGVGSDVYIVVQPKAPDESSPIEVRLHCRKA